MMIAQTLKVLTKAAIERLLETMQQSAPQMAQHAQTWVQDLAGSQNPEDYFHHPLAFPMLHLPCWAELHLRDEIDFTLQADLVYSSVNGYYFIRLIDNVMDEQRPREQQLLPMAGFFHAEMTSVYRHRFAADHPFWSYYNRWNAQSAEFAICDSLSTQIDLAHFTHIAGQKVVGAKVPLVAVLSHYNQLDRLPAWETFYHRLSCWHQMLNDLLSWPKDYQHQTPSYVLSEGARQRRADQTLLAWLVDEGLAWGFQTLETWLVELKHLAEPLHSEALQSYLNQREHLLHQQAADWQASASSLSQLLHLAQIHAEAE